MNNKTKGKTNRQSKKNKSIHAAYVDKKDG